MKKLLIPFLMTMNALVPFSSNAQIADFKTTYPIPNSPEEEAWVVRLKEFKDARRSDVTEEEFVKLSHYFICESDQVIVVDLREKCDRTPEFWAEGFHHDFNQTTVKLEQKENESLAETLNTIYVRIENGEFPINHPSLVTLEELAWGEFAKNLENRYVRFPIGDDNLKNDLFVDHFLQHTLNFFKDYHIRVQYLPHLETTIYLLIDCYDPEEMVDNPLQTNNDVSRQEFQSSANQLFRRSPIAISKPASSYVFYDTVICGCGVSAGGGWEWGGNEPSKGYLYGNASAYDDQGNNVSLHYERNGERNRLNGEMGHEDKRRGRAEK